MGEPFPIDVFQTGSGTSSNMNANEVIATLAARAIRAASPSERPRQRVTVLERRHPVGHPPGGDRWGGQRPHPALTELAEALEAKAAEFAEVVKSGRTTSWTPPGHPGQEFGGYAAQVRYGIERLEATLPRVAELALGGTAVGTGINAPAGFAAAVIGELRETTGLPLTEARNHFEAQGAQDGLVELSGQLRTVAIGLYKIATDIRWMGSGPRAGLAEIHVPDLQPGSSIMPGKVNPVVAEALSMVCAQVIGNDAAVAFGGSQGNFELNIMLPVLARNVLESIRLLASSSRLFADRCVRGITADEDRAREYAEGSPSVATALNPVLGYEEAASIAKQALAERKSIRDVVIERGHVGNGTLTLEDLDRLLDVKGMTRPSG